MTLNVTHLHLFDPAGDSRHVPPAVRAERERQHVRALQAERREAAVLARLAADIVLVFRLRESLAAESEADDGLRHAIAAVELGAGLQRAREAELAREIEYRQRSREERWARLLRTAYGYLP